MSYSLCILDNDTLDAAVAPTYGSYGAMLERLLRNAGAQQWQITLFDATRQQFPGSYDGFDAVLLTGSKADAFGDEPWVVALRQQVRALLAQRKKLLGVCFGHQLIAHCLGAPVGRSDKGWGTGRMRYRWLHPDLPGAQGREEIALLASHQDQVQALPEGMTLLASSDFCPVAAYGRADDVLCVQAHPEFVPAYSEYLLNKRQAALGAEHYGASMASLVQGHEGEDFARMMVAFVQGRLVVPGAAV
ncbi:MAG: glutamine amidotransferase-related protein [Rhodoferax sp.]